MFRMYKIFAVAPVAALLLAGCGSRVADNHGSLPLLGSKAAPRYAARTFVESERPMVVIKAHSMDRTPAPVVVAESSKSQFKKPADSPAAMVVEEAQFASVRTPATEAPLAAVVPAPKVSAQPAAKGPAPLELQYVHEQWERLPEAVKSDLLSIIKAATEK